MARLKCIELKSSVFKFLSSFLNNVRVDLDFVYQSMWIVHFNPNLYGGAGGGGKFAPRQFFCHSSKTVGTRFLKLCDFYC